MGDRKGELHLVRGCHAHEGQTLLQGAPCWAMGSVHGRSPTLTVLPIPSHLCHPLPIKHVCPSELRLAQAYTAPCAALSCSLQVDDNEAQKPSRFRTHNAQGKTVPLGSSHPLLTEPAQHCPVSYPGEPFMLTTHNLQARAPDIHPPSGAGGKTHRGTRLALPMVTQAHLL